jgi:hypothetical protein
MELSIDQIRGLIKNPKNRVNLERAVDHQRRISFHAQAVDDVTHANLYKERFLKWVKDGIKLPADKFAVFSAMLRFPLHTNSLVSSIFDEFSTIFTAQDSYRDYEFANPDYKDEFDQYLENAKVQEYIASSIFQSYKERHNSLLVVDLPAIQNTERPMPYFYELPIERVIDIDVTERAGDERIDYVIFKTEVKDEVACFDGVWFRVFMKTSDGEYVLMTEARHELNFCPATFVSAFPLSATDRITRKSPLSESASDLDWLLFLKTAKRQYEIYGAFPIVWSHETECDFTDGHGTKCNAGIIAGTTRDGIVYQHDCPACAESKFVGPGTHVKKVIPRGDEKDLGDPAGIIPPDIDSLKNLTEECDKVEWDVFTNVVGGVDGVLNKQAINEIQASAIVESKRKKYLSIASNFEKAEKFIVDTFGLLMYPGYYNGSTINYGSQFDLYTSENVQKQLNEQKKTGMPQYVLDQTLLLYIQSANRNNYAEQQRLELLRLIEPYPTLSIQECINIGVKEYNFGEFVLKANFAKFVSNFELENGNIVNWGSALDPNVNVQRLRKIFEDYAKQIKPPDVREPGQGQRAPVSQ